METRHQDQELTNFLKFCTLQIEYVERRHYVNSVKVTFNKSILVDVFTELTKLNYKFFVYHSILDGNNNIVLFIYKKKEYVFN